MHLDGDIKIGIGSGIARLHMMKVQLYFGRVSSYSLRKPHMLCLVA